MWAVRLAGNVFMYRGETACRKEVRGNVCALFFCKGKWKRDWTAKLVLTSPLLPA